MGVVNFVNVELEQAKRDFYSPETGLWELDRLRLGRDAWILQTHVRLKEQGYETALHDRFEVNQVCLAHFDDLEHATNRNMVYLVAVRADRPTCPFADWEIVLNRVSAKRRNQIFIPHWMQSALIPRDPARGNEIKAVAYIGNPQELRADLRDEGFRSKLGEESMRFDLPQNWLDFSQIDVILAVRSGDPAYHTLKPAQKLINAWAAGIPAVMGPEPAYDEIRKSDLDYLVAANAPEALAALRRLRSDPALYRAMVENGLRRAKEFTHAEVAKRWIEAFENQIVPAYERWNAHPNPLRTHYRRLRNHLLKRKFHQARLDFDAWHRANIQRVSVK